MMMMGDQSRKRCGTIGLWAYAVALVVTVGMMIPQWFGDYAHVQYPKIALAMLFVSHAVAAILGFAGRATRRGKFSLGLGALGLFIDLMVTYGP